tara:strand:+ start:861 stop:1064 length:204 start_codon:yes stop_codon:yes gene_type:complete
MLSITRLSFISAVLAFVGCTTIKTEHHITLDHNITIKIEKEVNSFLDDLYGDLDTEENNAENGKKPE